LGNQGGLSDMREPTPAQKIGFGGGCHWCTEAVFQALNGVTSVEQGYIKSDPPHETWSEAVDVTFNPAAISAACLIEIHLRTHSSTSQHKLRGKYRSAVYVHNVVQQAEAHAVITALKSDFDAPIVTLVLAHRGFKSSADQFQNYYKTDPERPFCQTYIDPKLMQLRQKFARHTKT